MTVILELVFLPPILYFVGTMITFATFYKKLMISSNGLLHDLSYIGSPGYEGPRPRVQWGTVLPWLTPIVMVLSV